MKVTGKSMAQPSRKILAAGGILLGKGAHEGQVAIVRRPRYGGENQLSPKERSRKAKRKYRLPCERSGKRRALGQKSKSMLAPLTTLLGIFGKWCPIS